MMNVHNDLSRLPDAARGCVLAIGNFDGVHKGHQRVIAEAQRWARAAGAPLGVMTFEPHPRAFFQPGIAPFRLTPAPAKARLLAALGVDHLFVPAFDAAFAALDAQAFIALLTDTLQARHVVIGHDFAFGRGRAGTLAQLGAALPTTVVAPVCDGSGIAYASSEARAALLAGDLARAEAILGRPFEIEAEVIHGNKRGREFGMPTANQTTGDYLHLPYGVYAVEALIEGEKDTAGGKEDTTGGKAAWRPAVANYGIRPMFEVAEPLLETHLFDFSGDLYGKVLRVRPVRYLRGEAKFPSLDALIAQMKDDCLRARAILSSQETYTKNIQAKDIQDTQKGATA